MYCQTACDQTSKKQRFGHFIRKKPTGSEKTILLSKTITYAARQLVIKHQRNSALAILQGRDEAYRLRENN